MWEYLLFVIFKIWEVYKLSSVFEKYEGKRIIILKVWDIVFSCLSNMSFIRI